VGRIELINKKEANPMNQAVRLDRLYAELIEVVWECDRQWPIDDRINAAIKYGRSK
jgi:hypothetical protein